MPSSTVFSLPHIESLHSREESMLDGSDFEDLYRSPARGSSSAHYWLGKQMFLHLLGEIVFHEAAAGEATDTLDGALMSKIANHPYQARMDRLASISAQNNVPMRSTDSPANFQILATEIGILLATRNAEIKSSIASIIQEGMLDGTQTTLHPIGSQRHSSSPLNQRARNRVELNSNEGHDEVLELPRYTTALKEYADRSDSIIEWSEKQLSLSPLCWMARVIVDGAAFEATAGNKKEAKHRASRRACKSLSIEI